MPALSTAQILETFTKEINAHQGAIDSTFDDGQHLFARSVLPQLKEVRPGDQLQGGVALKATDLGVWLHPYLYRLICQNGAIIAETLETRVLNLNEEEPETVLQSIREGVQACCVPKIFHNTVRKVQTASARQVNLAIVMLPLIKVFTGRGNNELPTDLLKLIFAESDKTQFGIANVITAIARDTRDPQLRWDLEELGGSLIIGYIPTDPNQRGSARDFPSNNEFHSNNPLRHRSKRAFVTT